MPLYEKEIAMYINELGEIEGAVKRALNPGIAGKKR